MEKEVVKKELKVKVSYDEDNNKIERQYANDDKLIVKKHYDSNGTLRNGYYYNRDGKLSSSYTYDANGNLISEKMYANGFVVSNETRQYDDSGKLHKINTYNSTIYIGDNGKPFEEYVYDDEGDELYFYKYEYDKNDRLIHYYKYDWYFDGRKVFIHKGTY